VREDALSSLPLSEVVADIFFEVEAQALVRENRENKMF
jgi:hypothetical protein